MLLLRRPVVFLAIVAASGILAVAAASGPLFLSTIASASLEAQARSTCPEEAQPTVTATAQPNDAVAAEQQGTGVMRADGLSTYATLDAYTQVSASFVHLFSRAGALDHVTKLTPDTGAAGAWLPNVFARALNARPGSVLRTSNGATIRVAGIYRDLAPSPFALSNLPRYWCHWHDQLVPNAAPDAAVASTPPDSRYGIWMIADPATVAADADSPVTVLWSQPMSAVTAPLSAFDAADARASVAAETLKVGTGRRDGSLAAISAIARAGRQGVSGSVVPIQIAGVIVAALLVGGSGLFWAAARRREIRLLVSRGVGPFALAGKAILETLPAMAVGGAAGLAGATYLVRHVGPSQALEADAPRQALLLVAASVALGASLVGAIGLLASRDRTTGRRASWLRLVPWEIALLALAGAFAATSAGGSAVSINRTVVKIDPVVVLYPLLGATAALLLLGRLVGALLPNLGRASRRRGNIAYLTLRRMARSRAVVVGLIVGTALPVCLLVYGSTVTTSISDNVRQKYETNLGAPHVLQIYGAHSTLFDTRSTGTHVARYDDQTSLDGDPASVLGVDPATFARYAFTTSGQRDALREISGDHAAGDIPAIIVNRGAAAGDTQVQIGMTRLSVRPVASLAVFPGLRDSYSPLVVLDLRALDGPGGNSRIDENIERVNQLWTSSADYPAAQRLMGIDDYTVLFELTSAVVVGTTGLLPVTWLFGYLRALAVLIGIVAVAGLVFGLAARTRRRRVSYVLSRRMGLSKTAHLGSLLLELALVVGLGWVAGSGLGLGSFGTVVSRFDVYPSLRPPIVFATPLVPVQVSLAVAVTVAVLSAASAHLLAERTKPAQILRLE